MYGTKMHTIVEPKKEKEQTNYLNFLVLFQKRAVTQPE